jgi:hypothetical protein
VLHAPAREGLVVYVLRGRQAPHSIAELDALVAGGRDVTITPLHNVGFASRSPLAQYQRDDMHAIVHDSFPGEVTACYASRDTAPTPRCVSTTIDAKGSVHVLPAPR